MQWTTGKTAGLALGIILLVIAIATTTYFYLRHRKHHANTNTEKPVDVESPAPSTPNQDANPVAANQALANNTSVDAASRSSPRNKKEGRTIITDGTVRRTTGHPQTFVDWVEKTKEIGPNGERLPRDQSAGVFQHNSASPLPIASTPSTSHPQPPPSRPVSADVLSLMSSIPKVSRAEPKAVRSFTLPPIPAMPAEKPKSARDSWGASSFRKAVLSAGGSERAKEILAKVERERKAGERDDGNADIEVKEEEEEEMLVKMEGEGRGRSYSGAWPQRGV